MATALAILKISMKNLKIGLIGLDTSHVPAFAQLFNDETQKFHVPGGRVVAAFPGGSPDFELSWKRVEGFTHQLRDEFGVSMLDSPAAVAQACDAIIVTAVDGRAHLSLFREIAPLGKPVFIDKPFALSSADARAIADLAREKNVPLMSSSSLRYAQPLIEALENAEIYGADCSGPMAIEPTQPGLFWYGIHSIEMLFAVMRTGCLSVQATKTDDHEFVVGIWNDGRIGTVRGNRKGNPSFGATLHEAKGTRFVNAYDHPKPATANLLGAVMAMFQTEKPSLDITETLEIVRFIEAANQSRDSGERVDLEKEI